MKDRHLLPWLDLFRFAAAFVVMTVHTRGFLFVSYNNLEISERNIFVAFFYAITRIGYEAVIVFFVLSGFLVGGKTIERLINGSFSPNDYLINRIARIYSPLLPAIGLTTLCIIFTSGNINIYEIFCNLFSLQGVLADPLNGNEPLWSLSYEFWFYILAYVVGSLIISNKNKFIGFCFLILVLFILCVFLNPTFLFCWLIGAIAYFLKPEKKSVIILLSSIFVCVLSTIAIEVSLDSKSLELRNFAKFLPSVNILYILLSAGFAIVLQQVLLFVPKNKFSIKINAIGTYLASFSYTLYLIHYPLLNLLSYFGFVKFNQFNSKSISYYIIAICFLMIFAWLIYLPFERRTDYFKLKLKRIFI